MILGITGTNGAGKGTVVEHLKEKGFAHYSASGFITEEVVRRGLPVNRTSMQEVGIDLRRIHGPAYLVETLYLKAIQEGGDAIIESIREAAGAAFLKERRAFLVTVDADRRIRYERAILRGSAKDTVTFEQFCEQEDRELDARSEFGMQIRSVMALADYVIHNDGTLKELHLQVDAMLMHMRTLTPAE
jgi:dephospho-CoA kinase